jgi:arylsulfatase A-like enzyme
MTLRRRCWFHVTVAAALAAAAPSSLAQGAAKAKPADRPRPNILVIMTDQQHAHMLSCAGNPYLSTPALDRLARMGTRFELAHAANPVCVPSRFSLQTGRMPSTIGMRTNEVQLKVPRALCAQSLGPLLSEAGYRCVYGGKDHTPRDLSKYMMAHGYERLTPDRRDGLAKACAEFLRGPHDRPFFLFASFINPHDICYMAINDLARSRGRPMVANEDSRMCERLLDEARQSGDLNAFVREHCPPLPGNFAVPQNEPESIEIDYAPPRSFRRYAREQWSEPMWRLHRWLYCRLTEQVDAQIGTVLQALEQAGLEDSTLVVFTSDHGDMNAAHRLEHKSVLYDESVRVPLLVAWKGVLPAGRVDDEHLVSNGLDLLPTLCEYAGISPPGDLPGRSLRPLLEAHPVSGWRDHVVAESRNGRMVRTARFKYCVYEHGQHREMLIDMRRDPGEMKNLAEVPEYRDELNRHRRLLMSWVRRHNDSAALSYVVPPAEAPAGTRPAAN